MLTLLRTGKNGFSGNVVCRVRRLRRTVKSYFVAIAKRFSRRITDNQNKMNMIWHDHILIDKYVLVLIIHQTQILFHQYSEFAEADLRYVASVVPYELP